MINFLGIFKRKKMVIYGGQPLIQSNVTKFLGVYLEEHLTWKYDINFVCKQIAKSIGILSRTRFYLSCKTKLALYYTLIYPYITYCNSTWSCTVLCKRNANEICRNQRNYANFGTQISNFRFRRKCGEISVLLLF